MDTGKETDPIFPTIFKKEKEIAFISVTAIINKDAFFNLFSFSYPLLDAGPEENLLVFSLVTARSYAVKPS